MMFYNFERRMRPNSCKVKWKRKSNMLLRYTCSREKGIFISFLYRESMAGSVIQATGMVEFEDGLWIGNPLKARNGLQRVRTIPGVRPGAVRTPGLLRGQTEFQSAWVCVAAWC